MPYAFYFGGFWNWANGTFTGAFTLQLFTDFKAGPPPQDAFALPSSCSTAKACTNWPADSLDPETDTGIPAQNRPHPFMGGNSHTGRQNSSRSALN